MKKILFAMAALFGCIAATHAQSTQVATLTHGSDNTMFYGAYALRDALEQAESGDIINLSSGTFQAAEIYKAITLRGAGIDSALPTYLVNEFNVILPAEDTNRFTMEGIRCNNKMSLRGTMIDPCFTKCKFDAVTIGWESGDNINNAMFGNCKIINGYKIYKGTIQFVNCYLTDCSYRQDDSPVTTYLNCIMRQSYPEELKNSELFNCVIYTPTINSGDYFVTTSSVTNCVCINFANPYQYLPKSSGCSTSTFAEVFKNFTGEYSDDQTFELTDNAKTTLLGTDGSQVGIYGGVLPYTSTPSYPLFTKMNVANKTTTDGKLSVDIEVSAGK